MSDQQPDPSSSSSAFRVVVESGAVPDLGPEPMKRGGGKAPPRPLAVAKPQPVKPVTAPQGGGKSLAEQMAEKKLQKSSVTYASLDDELVHINEALAQGGFSYRVPEVGALRDAKKAAGLGSTKTPAPDFNQFALRLKAALALGALGGADAKGADQAKFTNDFVDAVAKALPKRAQAIRAKGFGFADVKALAAVVSEKEIHELTPAVLAASVAAKMGTGALAGLFPGEAKEATAAEGGKDRLGKMIDLGHEIVQFLSTIKGINPEVTGSIILSEKGYTGTPDDLDINVTTTGTDKERKEAWEGVVAYMNDFDGVTVPLPKGGNVRVYPLTPGKVQGENANIWERRYAYAMEPKDGEKKVMPFEVEVKDVGGKVWKEHLKEGGPTRETENNGASLPQWLMLDSMTRILGHRATMKESAARTPDPDEMQGVSKADQPAKWLEMVRAEGLKLSRSKRLWEKMSVSAKAARKHKTMQKTDLSDWLLHTVKDWKAYDDLLELIDDEAAYEKWLLDIGKGR